MKFKLTSETKTEFGIKLFRIEATESFSNVSKGEKGGWVEKEANLDMSGNAWVYGDARVYGNACVSGNARVYGNACVYGKLKLLAGFFFGVRYKKEEIKYVEVDSDIELIYKGEAKFGEEEKEMVEVTLEEIAKMKGIDVSLLRIKE